MAALNRIENTFHVDININIRESTVAFKMNLSQTKNMK